MRKVAFFLAGIAFSLILGFSYIYFFTREPLPRISGLVESGSVSADEIAQPSTSPAPITLDSIFDSAQFESYETDTVLYATGDIIPARITDSRIRTHGSDYPFEKISEVLGRADIVLANLEAPLIASCPRHLDGMIFCGIPSFAQAMNRHHISFATLENNHISNYGLPGKEETVQHLIAHDVSPVLAGQPKTHTEKALTFGFLAVNGVGSPVNLDRVRADIDAVRDSVDIVVVSVHWGREYSYIPARAAGIAPDEPQTIAHALIDAGADLIIGNHPHWVQGVEQYRNGFVTYAHGNFIFDQAWSRETREGVIGSYIFRDKKLVDVSFIPVIIDDYAQPRLALEQEASRILSQMRTSSQDIAQ